MGKSVVIFSVRFDIQPGRAGFVDFKSGQESMIYRTKNGHLMVVRTEFKAQISSMEIVCLNAIPPFCKGGGLLSEINHHFRNPDHSVPKNPKENVSRFLLYYL